MSIWELFRIAFAVLIGVFSFHINNRMFTTVFRQMERNFNQSTDMKTKNDSTDAARSGTLLSVSASSILAYYIWKNPDILSLIVSIFLLFIFAIIIIYLTITFFTKTSD